MPQFNFQSPLTSRALLNANLMSPRKYGLLQNEESNHKGIIDGIKKRKLNAPAEQGENKRLVNSLQKHQFDASPYFQNLSQGTSQKIQNQNSQGHDSMKTFNNKSHGKVKVIDVTVIPPSPVTFNNTNPNKNQSTNNDTFVQKTQHIPLTSYNSNNERGQFMDPKIKFDNNRPKTSSLAGMNKDATRPLRRESNKNIFSFQKSTNNAEQEPINSQDLLFSQESVTNQLKDNQTGLTPEMIQFKLLSGSRKDNTDEDKENNEVHCEDQGTESQSFVCNEDNYGRSLNNSFSIEPSFRYENANNSSTFGQFDRPNEIPRFQFGDAPNQLNVSGIDVQNYMDTGNENYVCSPINSFLLNTTDEKEDNKDENKNKQSNNFFFKFGECTSKNGPSGQKKLFDMFY
ncbi:putative uncharacterized protein DDB_G0282133 [Agrilus planipennis]|nr:putative uncharacterized protein DDB_G0282133 [Agrilus planipennis]XP_025836008.1 putative uncharacterized protein DDB_G0282133 [Agrilus planipennis]